MSRRRLPELVFGTLSAFAVHLIRLVGIAIFIAVANPHVRYALAVVAFEFILRTRFQLAVGFVVAIRTFLETVATLACVNTECRLIHRCRALELLFKAYVIVAADFVAAIATLIFSVADMRRADALPVGALVLARLACEWSARGRLVAAIATIVLAVAAPEKWNAFFRCGTLELGRCAIGDARLVVGGQVKLIGTFATIERLNRRQQTQCLTIGCLAWIFLCRPLTIRMKHTNVHRPMDRRQNGGTIVAAILVTRFNRLRFPVRPIDAILPHGNRENVMQVDQRILRSAQNRLSIVAIQIAARNEILASIAPIQFSRFEIDGERIWPSEAIFDDDARCAAIQAGLSNMGSFAPIGPIDITLIRIYGDGARLLQILVDQHFSILAVQLRHFNRVQTFVAPIQILRHPIDAQSVRIFQQRVMYLHRSIVRRAHTLYLTDCQRHIRPIVAFCAKIVVERNGIR